MNYNLYAKIKEDLFGGVIELVRRHWSKLIISNLLFLLLMALVAGYPLYLYISKVVPLFTSFLEDASNGVQQDPEAFQEAIESSAMSEMLLFQGILSLFGAIVGTWFQITWLKMGKDLILNDGLQPNETYLSGHKFASYLNAAGYNFGITIVSLGLSLLVNKIAPIMGFPFAMVMLMVTMQLYLVIPYIYLEELGIVESVKKSLATITPLIALKYAAFVFIGIIAASIGFVFVVGIVSLLLAMATPALGAIAAVLMSIVFFVFIMLLSSSFPSVVYFHHTDATPKDSESSTYDSFG